MRRPLSYYRALIELDFYDFHTVRVLRKKLSRDYLRFFDALSSMYKRGPMKRRLSSAVLKVRKVISSLDDLIGRRKVSREDVDALVSQINEINAERDFFLQRATEVRALNQKITKVAKETGISARDLNVTEEIVRGIIRETFRARRAALRPFSRRTSLEVPRAARELAVGVGAALAGPYTPVIAPIVGDVVSAGRALLEYLRRRRLASLGEMIRPISGAYREPPSIREALLHREGIIRGITGTRVRAKKQGIDILTEFFNRKAYRAKWTRELLNRLKNLGGGGLRGISGGLGGRGLGFGGFLGGLFGGLGLRGLGRSLKGMLKGLSSAALKYLGLRWLGRLGLRGLGALGGVLASLGTALLSPQGLMAVGIALIIVGVTVGIYSLLKSDWFKRWSKSIIEGAKRSVIRGFSAVKGFFASSRDVLWQALKGGFLGESLRRGFSFVKWISENLPSIRGVLQEALKEGLLSAKRKLGALSSLKDILQEAYRRGFSYVKEKLGGFFDLEEEERSPALTEPAPGPGRGGRSEIPRRPQRREELSSVRSLTEQVSKQLKDLKASVDNMNETLKQQGRSPIKGPSIGNPYDSSDWLLGSYVVGDLVLGAE